MEDSLGISNSNTHLESRSIVAKRLPRSFVFDSGANILPKKTLKCISSMQQNVLKSESFGDIAAFLLTTASLEIVRRVSRKKCPFIWRSFQAVQVLCYPPFNWLQKWSPFKLLIKHMEKLSRPLLLLTIATEVSNLSVHAKERSISSKNTHTTSEPRSESSSQLSSLDQRFLDDVPKNPVSEKWLLELHKELEDQGITLPERLGDDELFRFYAAANGDFSKLLSSVKNTIQWRQTYSIFSPQELKEWVHLAFWHGCDVNKRPCLIIRLGLACSNLEFDGKTSFVKAVVSQIEYGILNLVCSECPQVTVLMDCEGLTPFGFPMQMMRSCAVLLQDHFPNRLGCMIVVRLRPVARVIAKTLFQVLRPATRKKLVILGENYYEFLSDFLQSLPYCLGGKCCCIHCSSGVDNALTHSNNTDTPQMIPNQDNANDWTSATTTNLGPHIDAFINGANGKPIIWTATIGLLMFCIFFLVLAMAMQYKETQFFNRKK